MNDYVKIVSQLPICKGDMLYVISDILDLAKAFRSRARQFDRFDFIESLQRAVGTGGTLLFPTFNWDFCKGHTFDYRYTMGKTGALGNAALKKEGFARTKHPIYSFAVWGKGADDLVRLENKSGFGEGSPFSYMHEKHGKALVIGLSPSIGNTFLHYVEQSIGVDFRYEKEFSGAYIDKAGNTSSRTYSMYVRDLNINPSHTDFLELDHIMGKLGIIESITVDGIPFHIVNLCGLYDVVQIEIKYNHSKNLYIFPNQSGGQHV